MSFTTASFYPSYEEREITSLSQAGGNKIVSQALEGFANDF